MTGGTSFSQSLGTLTALDAALAQLRAFVSPVTAKRLPVARALGHVLAQDIIASTPLPQRARALRDGYALSSQEIAGASSYSPVMLMKTPVRVSIGDTLPDGCDCVLEPANLDLTGPMVQVMSEAAPGEGLRRAGEDAPVGTVLLRNGRQITARDLAILHEAQLSELELRIPRVALINRGSARISTQMVAAAIARFGAEPHELSSFDTTDADLVVTIGGTGEGEGDRTVQELRATGELLCHGIACAPGRSIALARRGSTPILALPGSPADVMAGWFFILHPLLMQMTGAAPQPGLRLPLAQKLASRVGVAELALLARRDDHFVPLCLGDMPLRLMAEATHIYLVSGSSEGHAAGEMIEACPFE